eukprot:COSAG01_NODE_35147_length_536_cov_1.052632_1_plen_71_part_10
MQGGEPTQARLTAIVLDEVGFVGPVYGNTDGGDGGLIDARAVAEGFSEAPSAEDRHRKQHRTQPAHGGGDE